MKESDLTNPVENWLLDQGYLVRREFRNAWGICDLVALSPNPTAIRHRLKLGQKTSIGSVSRFSILDVIPDVEIGRSVHINTVCKKLSGILCSDRIETHVKSLLKMGFLSQPKKNHLQKINGWHCIEKKVIAVELKLNRIQEAIYQARNNQLFADLSYIGLPKQKIKTLKSKNFYPELVEYGIGVISIDGSEVKVVLDPSEESFKPREVLRAYSAERFWPDLVKGKVS